MQPVKNRFLKKDKNDNWQRLKFAGQEVNLFLLNLIQETQATQVEKRYFHHSFNSRVSIRNRCLLTNRKQSVLSKIRISRLAFRKLALSGNIPGVQKACW